MDLEAENEPSIDGLIADFERRACEAEAGGYIYAEFEVDIAAMRALIASWRERGEALKEARGWMQDDVNLDHRHRGQDVLDRIDAALKDKP